MATLNMTEMELKELTEEQDEKHTEKDKKEEMKGEEEEGASVYCMLQNPTEEMCSSAPMPNSARKQAEDNPKTLPSTGHEDVKVSGDSKEKPTADAYKEARLYKRISAVFVILSVLFLAVVLALFIKLHEVQSIQKCPESPVVEKLNCTRDLCQTLYSSTWAIQSQGYQCSKYGKGWGRFKNSCYFKSMERLSWQESREACQKRGADLVVISNEHVQKFLTKNSQLLYWIGLRYSEAQQWMWINNTAPSQSYWSLGQPYPDSQSSCVLLNGATPQINNWFSNPCKVIAHYICQGH